MVNNMRPIDADKFDSFEFTMPEGLTEKEEDIFYDGMCYVLKMIEEAEECYKYGQWVPVSKNGAVSKCSNCGGIVHTYDLKEEGVDPFDPYDRFIVYVPEYEICPHCGAIMNDEEYYEDHVDDEMANCLDKWGDDSTDCEEQ